MESITRTRLSSILEWGKLTCLCSLKIECDELHCFKVKGMNMCGKDNIGVVVLSLPSSDISSLLQDRGFYQHSLPPHWCLCIPFYSTKSLISFKHLVFSTVNTISRLLLIPCGCPEWHLWKIRNMQNRNVIWRRDVSLGMAK